MGESLVLPQTATIWISGVILVASLMAACGGGGSVMVKQEDYGEQWPLTVPEAELFCKEYYSIYVKVGEKRYGVNGTGSTYVKKNYPSARGDLEDIWRADPRGIVPRVSITPLIEAGEELCDN